MKKKLFVAFVSTLMMAVSLTSCNRKYPKPMNGVLEFVFKSVVPEFHSVG
jgi:hypothetical protein